jgi:amino acid adenylation domain-containing protein
MPLLLPDFRACVLRAPGKAALRDDGRDVSYAALDRRAAGIAARLRAAGLPPGGIVGLRLPRCGAYVAAMLGVVRAGGIALPLDPALPSERLAAIRAVAPPVLEIAAEAPADLRIDPLAEAFETDAPGLDGEQDPHAPALLSFTSGSTGTPKGVLLSAANIAAGARAWRSDSPDAGARSLLAGAPGFIITFIELSITLTEGNTLVIVDEATRRDPGALLDLMAREEVTRAFIATTPSLALAEEGVRRPRPMAIRHWMFGSEPLRVTPALRAFAAALPGTVFVNTHGSTEAGPVARYVLPRDPAAWPATPPIGLPWAEVGCAVLDPEGRPVGPGRSGELVVAGPSVGLGYWQDPTRTAERFPRDVAGLPPGPAFRIGDIVRRAPDGVLHWVGRVDDQIKAGGYRIEPAEVEAALLEHPAVAEAAVAAQPDAAGRPRLVALVLPRGTMPPPGALARHVAARLPSYMVPALFAEVPALPRLPGGKLDRRALPTATPAPSAGRAAETPTELLLAACIAELLDLGTVPAEQDIFDLGLDSLRALELAAAVEARGLVLATADIFEARTVAAMAARLDGAARSAAAARLLPLTAAAARPGAPPLILVHSVGGMVFNYVPIALALPEFRCLGLQARGIEAGEAPDTDFNAMLDRYAEAVRTAVPEGPLRLLGYSFGGVVAHELMRRLRPNPGPGDLLLLIDAVNPARPGMAAPRSLDDVLRLGLAPTRPRLARWVRPLLPLLPRRVKLALGRDSIARFLATVPEALAFQHVSLRLVERIVAVWIGFSAMHATVRCAPHPVRTLLLRASERVHPGEQAQVEGWEDLVGDIVIRDLPGNHFTMLSPANVPAVAAALRDGLGLATT